MLLDEVPSDERVEQLLLLPTLLWVLEAELEAAEESPPLLEAEESLQALSCNPLADPLSPPEAGAVGTVKTAEPAAGVCMAASCGSGCLGGGRGDGLGPTKAVRPLGGAGNKFGKAMGPRRAKALRPPAKKALFI